MVSSVFIVGVGLISLTAIHKSQETAHVRAELENQVALVRNVRMHLIAYRLDHVAYRRGIIRNEFKGLLKKNQALVGLLNGEEKRKMDSIQTDLKRRAKNVNLYIENSIQYDSLVGSMFNQVNQLNVLINKKHKGIVVSGNVNDKLQWLKTRMAFVKLRPGNGKFNDLLSPVTLLSSALLKDKHMPAYELSTKLLENLAAFEDIYNNDKILYRNSDGKFPDIVSYTNNLIKEHSARNDKVLNFIWYSIILLTVLGSVFVYAISRFTSNSTIKGITSLDNISNEVSNGKIGIIIPITLLERKDEIGSLARSYHRMLEQINKVVKEITESATQILTTGQELSDNSQSISVSANQQASSLEEISSTVEEIVANIQQNTNNAISSKEKAQISAKGLMQLKEQNDKVFKSSLDIDDKTKIISDMAFQTNILSLNAAVEAAVAGSHGKSFGVVAAEVKKLADRSTEAAKIIVKLTKEGIELTKKGSELAELVLPEMESTNHLVNEIAVASQEQQDGVEQINTSIGILNQVSQENSIRADRLSENAVSLNQMSDKLTSAIDFFSIESFEHQENKKNTMKNIAIKFRLIKQAN